MFARSARRAPRQVWFHAKLPEFDNSGVTYKNVQHSVHNGKSLYHANVRKHVTVPEKALQKFTVPGYPKHTESSLKLSSERDACVFKNEEQGTVTHRYLPEVLHASREWNSLC